MGTLIADTGDIVSNRVLCKLDTSIQSGSLIIHIDGYVHEEVYMGFIYMSYP